MSADFVTASCIGRRGEFGNQLFQIAAVLGHAHRKGIEAVFRPWTCSLVGVRDYSVHYPNLNYRNHIHPLNTYEELRFAYDEIPSRPALDLIGSFQSEKYFLEIRDRVKELFREPAAIGAEVTALLKTRNISDYAVLQMRYNDRDGIDHNVLMHNLPEHYFIEAAKLLPKDGKIVIVTNSPTRGSLFAKRHLRDRDYLVSSSRNSLVDFYLITRARAVVISNSTFGWWGAYLNKNVDRVYAPLVRRWFGFPTRLDPRWSTEDLYPAHFVEVPF